MTPMCHPAWWLCLLAVIFDLARRLPRYILDFIASWFTATALRPTNMVTRPALEFLLNNALLLLATAILTQIATTCIYCCLFHPLAKIPGPFLPAITKLYQSYHNCRYYLEIECLHSIYSLIIQINLNEVHLAADVDNYDCIHHISSKYSKLPNFYNAIYLLYLSFGMLDNKAYCIKCSAMNPVFL